MSQETNKSYKLKKKKSLLSLLPQSPSLEASSHTRMYCFFSLCPQRQMTGYNLGNVLYFYFSWLLYLGDHAKSVNILTIILMASLINNLKMYHAVFNKSPVGGHLIWSSILLSQTILQWLLLCAYHFAQEQVHTR